MTSDLFAHNLTDPSFAYGPFAIKETEIKEKKHKTKTNLTEIGKLAERISSKISNHEEISELLNDEEIFAMLKDPKLKKSETEILGEYLSEERSIYYYGDFRENDVRLFDIVQIHERFHAIHHLALDEKGNIWDNFGSAPSFYKELLAQLFTFKVVENNNNHKESFLHLNERQSGEYRTWKIFESFSERQCEELYWEIRHRIVCKIGLGWLEKLSGLLSGEQDIDSIVTTSLKTTINRFREKPFYHFTEADIHSALAADLLSGSSDLFSTRFNNFAVSYIHQEYPTYFRYEKGLLLSGYKDKEEITSLNYKDENGETYGDRGNFDLVILNGNFIEKIFRKYKFSEAIKLVINKNCEDVKEMLKVMKNGFHLNYVFEVKFLHVFNHNYKAMIEEIMCDNEKLRLAYENSNKTIKPINLVFCAADRGESKVVGKIEELMSTNKLPEEVLNIFVSSYLDPYNQKSTPKTSFSTNSGKIWAIELRKALGSKI